MSGEILFLAHRMPFPPNRGDKIRSHHLLRYLADRAPVHVGCFAETDADRAAATQLAALASSQCVVERSRPLLLAGAEALVTRRPVSLAAFSSTRLQRWVRETLAQRTVGTIFVFSGQMGQYVPSGFGGTVIVDLCDVDSAKFEAYGARSLSPRGAIDRREGRLLKAEEARLARRADHTLLVSEAEAELLRSRLDPAGTDIRMVGNGIDTDLFAPQAVDPHPALAEKAPHIVFTGQMDYAPNVAACLRTIRTLLPQLRKVHPHAAFHIVGRSPVRDLLRHDGSGGVRVWGEVPDVRPFLAGADLVLAPLEIARGVQNKVLEAMAMARPVVLSPQAATGIGAQDGRHLAIGHDNDGLVARSLELLADGPRALAMGAAARRFVAAEKSWEAALAPLAGMIAQEAGRRDAA